MKELCFKADSSSDFLIYHDIASLNFSALNVPSLKNNINFTPRTVGANISGMKCSGTEISGMQRDGTLCLLGGGPDCPA
jgi:hypothetical protein